MPDGHSVTLIVPPLLAAEAEEKDVDLVQAAQDGIARAVGQTPTPEEIRHARETCLTWNRFHAEHGSFADEFGSF